MANEKTNKKEALPLKEEALTLASQLVAEGKEVWVNDNYELFTDEEYAKNAGVPYRKHSEKPTT